jgi:hypothetical protein
MNNQRFYFTVLGRFDCVWACSLKEARHKLMYSDYARVYRHIVWI